MIPVRVTVEAQQGVVEYVVHVVNRSRHALHGALRAAKKRYPVHRSVMAEFTEPERRQQHEPLRRVFTRRSRRAA